MSPNGDTAPCKHSFTAFRYPGGPEPAGDPAGVPVQPEPALTPSPVLNDAPIEPIMYMPSTPTGWRDPVVISGSTPVNLGDGADSRAPLESMAPAGVTPISAAPNAPTYAPAWLAAVPEPILDPAPGFDAPEPQRDAVVAPDGPLTGRIATEAALHEKAQCETIVDSTRTHAADDDSASTDNESIENS